ncbi:hypothetical protein VmeM32_00096 [Vibrio phage vB_VmeM-32]|nr:hypothetical protein VmeM32_00096 [Vibrio phage vB_VmeM-32]
MGYLTESKLGEILNEIFPNEQIIHNKSVPNSNNSRSRPDFRIESKKLIFEFDGYSHYNQTRVIKSDRIKDDDYSSLGYTVIRIPYFVQFDFNLLEIYNLTEIVENCENLKSSYPHGFIDKKALLPCDFCEMGVKRFIGDLNKFHIQRTDIIDSIKNKIIEIGDINLVLPKSIQYLIWG